LTAKIAPIAVLVVKREPVRKPVFATTIWTRLCLAFTNIDT